MGVAIAIAALVFLLFTWWLVERMLLKLEVWWSEPDEWPEPPGEDDDY